MIPPTVGAGVWFGQHKEGCPQTEPLAGIITKVHNDECVNLTVFGENGVPRAVTNVKFFQDLDDDPGCHFCTFVPEPKEKSKEEEPDKLSPEKSDFTDA